MTLLTSLILGILITVATSLTTPRMEYACIPLNTQMAELVAREIHFVKNTYYLCNSLLHNELHQSCIFYYDVMYYDVMCFCRFSRLISITDDGQDFNLNNSLYQIYNAASSSRGTLNITFKVPLNYLLHKTVEKCIEQKKKKRKKYLLLKPCKLDDRV